MRDRWQSIFPLMVGALVAIGGCVGTEVGNPQDDAEITLEFVAYEEEPAPEPTPMALTLPDGARIDEAWLVLEEIRLRPLHADDDEGGETRFETEKVVVELIGGAELPGPPRMGEPTTTYERLRIDMGAVDIDELPAGAPDELDDRSILLKGHAPDGRAFVFAGDFDLELELRGSFTLVPGANPLLVGFALDRWVRALDLEGADGDPIVIDAERDSARVEAFREALRTSPALFRDLNDDGALQDEEAEAALADANHPIDP